MQRYIFIYSREIIFKPYILYQSMILYILDGIYNSNSEYKEKIDITQSRKMYMVRIEVFQQTAEKTSQFTVNCIHDINLNIC